MELFDFIKVVFTNPSEYSSIAPGEKRKHYFMCQRRFAINFPMQANALQNLKINQAAVIDFWQMFLRKQYKFVPGWMYTKGVKKAQEVKEKQIPISKEVIKEYCRYYKVDSKSVYDALEFYPGDMTKELKDFEAILKQK
jgi:hypothetical protein